MIQAIRTGGFFHIGRAPHGAKRSAARREKEAGMENATQEQAEQQEAGEAQEKGGQQPQQAASVRAALVDSVAKTVGVASICNTDI